MNTATADTTHFTPHRYTVLDKWLADADVTIFHKTFNTTTHTVYVHLLFPRHNTTHHPTRPHPPLCGRRPRPPHTQTDAHHKQNWWENIQKLLGK